jgi:hypothetical protein
VNTVGEINKYVPCQTEADTSNQVASMILLLQKAILREPLPHRAEYTVFLLKAKRTRWQTVTKNKAQTVI